MIVFNVMRAVFAALMLFTSNSPVLFLASLYIATLATGGDAVITSAATADIFDYQQWKTGKRLEGFITQFGGMLVTAATMGSAFILPYFYRHYGLGTDYTVLYEASIRTPIFNIMIITSVISSLLAVIPILFYNLTEKKQKLIIEDLKQRAQENDSNETVSAD